MKFSLATYIQSCIFVYGNISYTSALTNGKKSRSIITKRGRADPQECKIEILLLTKRCYLQLKDRKNMFYILISIFIYNICYGSERKENNHHI
jgi:hypothetical protein